MKKKLYIFLLIIFILIGLFKLTIIKTFIVNFLSITIDKFSNNNYLNNEKIQELVYLIEMLKNALKDENYFTEFQIEDKIYAYKLLIYTFDTLKNSNKITTASFYELSEETKNEYKNNPEKYLEILLVKANFLYWIDNEKKKAFYLYTEIYNNYFITNNPEIKKKLDFFYMLNLEISELEKIDKGFKEKCIDLNNTNENIKIKHDLTNNFFYEDDYIVLRKKAVVKLNSYKRKTQEIQFLLSKLEKSIRSSHITLFKASQKIHIYKHIIELMFIANFIQKINRNSFYALCSEAEKKYLNNPHKYYCVLSDKADFIYSIDNDKERAINLYKEIFINTPDEKLKMTCALFLLYNLKGEELNFFKKMFKKKYSDVIKNDHRFEKML